MRERGWFAIFAAALGALLLVAGMLLVVRSRLEHRIESSLYTPLSGEADWQGGWELSIRGADPSEAGSLAGTDRVTIPFTGTAIALKVRRGGYRAYFWIEVDGEPANRLPRTGRGAYLVLSSPDYEPETVTVPLASGLEQGSHVVEIVADRGWDQWPLVGWRVTRGPNTVLLDRALAGLAAVAAACTVGLIGSGVNWLMRTRGGESRRVGSAEAPPVLPGLRSIYGSRGGSFYWPLFILAAAGAFYASPWPPVTLVSGLALAGLILLRLDLGLALVALSAPFYMQPRPLLGKAFAMSEILVVMCLVSWSVRQAIGRRIVLRRLASLSSPDLAVLSLVVVAATSTLFADRQHVALRELRVVVIEPALLYLMVRTTRLREGAIWRIVDGLVLGAVVVAVIGLVQYALGMNVISAEGGFRRLRSVYGSPNNAALYLGRALPVLLGVAAFGQARQRRLVYGACAVPVGLAILLSFSRAAFLLGIPVSILAMGVAAGGRWRWIAVGLVVLGGVCTIPLMSTPRFAGLLDPQSGTLFFRVQLWRASWTMFTHHPWVGVGPDNFLYAYRGRYILPSAWQEPHLSHAHNLLLTSATRLGILGLVVGLWLHVAFWQDAVVLVDTLDRDRRALALGLVGCMAYVFAHGLVDASFFFVDLSLAFLLVLGLVQSLRRYGIHEQEFELQHGHSDPHPGHGGDRGRGGRLVDSTGDPTAGPSRAHAGEGV